MILIAGSDAAQQLGQLSLSPLARQILMDKQQSPFVYNFPSVDALLFELNMRSHIVSAAQALNESGATFANYRESRANPRYWITERNGGFQMRPDVTAADAINDFFRSGPMYAFECSAAVLIVLYKAVLDSIGPAMFNRYYSNIYLYDWNYDNDLRLISTDRNPQNFPGDILYFRNPDHHPAGPEWQGENVIDMGGGYYYGHGIGITTARDIIAKLNEMRFPGSRRSAYLTRQVVYPDFEYLRQLSMGVGGTGTRKIYATQDSAIAAIGSKIFIR
ncbi:protein-glutamine gamma-glutamyltransferase [Paenibacillus sp. GCM10023252]|uniref:protein-glutamine gamma-glutamyltransferase n=1 Tax=Paenibacillus sp. GCM10023252 TaxID=3252649 RepID=UPI0036D2AC40